MNLLGKVAKEFGEYVAGEDQLGVRSEDAAVERLLQRVSDGILPDDRREALAQLRDLLTGNPQAQVALGNAGLPVLCTVLCDERGDLEMVRGALECLVLAVHPGASSGTSRAGRKPQPGAINAELLVRVPGALALVVGLLQGATGSDFYVAYHTVQLLTALGAGNMPRLQEAVLAAPMGVARLMDLLGSDHEVLRNEALLLLVGLTRASADVQKIAAFEGAFERVLSIAREEGGADGGIVVQDCLELLNNLLRTNPGNQLMFRETGHVSGLLALLQVAPPRSSRRRGVARQAAANLLAALETVHLLLDPPKGPQAASAAEEKQREENRVSNQAALLRGSALDALLALALLSSSVPSPAVRTQALQCVQKLLVAMPQAQMALMEASLSLREGGSVPALQALLRPALQARNAGERAAAAAVLQAFCRGNSEGQSMLVATVLPVGEEGAPGGDHSTFGSELVRALAGPDPAAAAWAAVVLRGVLDGNSAGKERVLRIPLELPAGMQSAPSLLLPLCVSCLSSALQTGRSGYSACVLLRLLITWVGGCPVAATQLIEISDALPLLLDTLTGRFKNTDPVVRGLAAVLLGTCALPNAGSDGDSDGAGDRAAGHVYDDGENPLDRDFTVWLPAFEARLRSLVSASGVAMSAAAAKMPAAVRPVVQHGVVTGLQREIAELRARNSALEQSSAASNGAEAAVAQPSLYGESGALAVRAAEAEVRAGRAEAEAASLREELDGLQERYRDAATELDAARSQADEARVTAARLEADLKGLSSAYNNLEAHAFALEKRVGEHGAAPAGDAAPGVSEAEAARRETAAAEAAGAQAEEGLADLLALTRHMRLT
ncbi:hypothetical protein WJX81_004059 [Elliptochloris bilobata]|uniref:Vesicle tethering protein Uso1/P115-like head domain-containing protein n=1 Tax=Elliptochloris bilobata TaxID=381761 RepID=A0AAW1QUZ9_9CHLO